MSGTIAHHPDDNLLEQFVRRELPLGTSVIVSAHIEMCRHCQARAAEIESRHMAELLAGSDAVECEAPDFSGMMEKIVELPRRQADSQAETESTAQDHAPDEFIGDFRLPRALRPLAGDLRWNQPGEGIHHAMAPIDTETHCEFIFTAAGAGSPAHTHDGREYTLVLQGRFHDELGSYGSGDLLVRDASHEHQPVSDNGCLSFAVLDRPLRFTKGLPMLLNPLRRLRFRDGVARRNGKAKGGR